MIEENEWDWTQIDKWVKQEKCFALYRLPGSEHCCLVMQNTPYADRLYDIADLDNQTGFVFAPFIISDKTPVLLLTPDVVYSKIPWGGVFLNQSTEEVNTTPSVLYSDCFERFTTVLRAGKFDKLVLSRVESLAIPPFFSFSKAFRTACSYYPNSFVYLFYTPQTGAWLGATPEVLLSGQKGRFKTVALAGTRLVDKQNQQAEWDQKNSEEQSLVASYIRRQLLSLGIKTEEYGPYSFQVGHIEHLKTDINFSFPPSFQLGRLLKILHPTPAVCGLPKEEAYRFICNNEGYERTYYAGFTGWLSSEEQTDLYVNLRCLQLNPQGLFLYAGGGLLPSSKLHDEWLETEKKMWAIKSILA